MYIKLGENEKLDSACAFAIELEAEGNYEKACLIYEVCSLLGHLTAKTRLADLLSEQRIVLDVPRALRLYDEACCAGHAPACRNMSVLQAELGNIAMSELYLKKAKQNGDQW